MATPRATAINNAGQILANTWAHLATLTPQQWADEAYVPGGPTREELAARIRRLRAQARVAA